MSRMVRKIEGKTWLYCIILACIAVIVSYVTNDSILLAQEMDEQLIMTAMVQYTLKYRFDSELKVGDCIEYQLLGKGEETEKIEIKVTAEGKGDVWIEEKMQGQEFHMLVDLDNMKLLDGYRIDEEGNKESAPSLSDEQFAQAMSMIEKMKEQELMGSEIIGWKKGEGEEKVEVPAGSFTCSYLEPEYSEQHEKQMEDYVTLMKEQGKSSEEIAEWEKGTRLYFSEKVPKLLPFFTFSFIFMSPDAFKEVKGGLVKVPHLLQIELKSYSGQ
ncbi:hypothetical protein KAT73_00630 [candidate division WOR-3 bacterium]|nr:hypothetical protein [candidate division WOR-3 bacterium]